jgi:hypothetical protein
MGRASPRVRLVRALRAGCRIERPLEAPAFLELEGAPVLVDDARDLGVESLGHVETELGGHRDGGAGDGGEVLYGRNIEVGHLEAQFVRIELDLTVKAALGDGGRDDRRRDHPSGFAIAGGYAAIETDDFVLVRRGRLRRFERFVDVGRDAGVNWVNYRVVLRGTRQRATTAPLLCHVGGSRAGRTASRLSSRATRCAHDPRR